MTKSEYESRIQTSCLAILTIVTIAITLYLLRAVLVPFILAAFLTLILLPIVNFLIPIINFLIHKVPVIRNLNIARPIALFSTLVLGFLALFGTGLLITSSVKQFSDNSGQYEESLTELIGNIERYVSSSPILAFISEEETESDEVPVEAENSIQTPLATTPAPTEEPLDAELGVDTVPIFSISRPAEEESTFDFAALLPEGAVQGIAKKLSDAVFSVLSNGLLVMLFTAFLLAGSTTKTKPRTGVLGEIESRVQKYIGVKIVLSMLTGSLVYLVLQVLGVDYALSFGAFAFILNFVPNVGSGIATILPLPVVLLAPEISATTAVLAIAIPLTIQMVIGNVIEPKVMGDTLGLHPIVILMALVFWGMLWGFSGMLLAAPMTAIAKIIFARIEVTKPIAGLMEGRLETLDEI